MENYRKASHATSSRGRKSHGRDFSCRWQSRKASWSKMGQGILAVLWPVVKICQNLGEMERTQWASFLIWIGSWEDGVQADIQEPETSRCRDLHYQGNTLLEDSKLEKFGLSQAARCTLEIYSFDISASPQHRDVAFETTSDKQW